ncbi:MAG: hypothetical protein IPH93_02435 [Saprospiraceae bacterium]|nr:hypothetical protein [Saprospiraceae bacterium]
MTYVTQRNNATTQQCNNATTQQRKRRLFLNFIALIFALNPIFSQSINLFSNSSVQMNDLDTQLVNALNGETGIDLQHAEIKNIYDSVPSIGTIFNHYELDSGTNTLITYQFEVSHVQQTGQGEHHWWANCISDHYGELFIMRKHGVIGGFLNTKDEKYALVPFSQGGVIKAKRIYFDLDTDNEDAINCGDSEEIVQDLEGPSGPGPDPDPCEEGSPCTDDIDVLILYDQSGVDWINSFGFIEVNLGGNTVDIPIGIFIIAPSIYGVNYALANSNIGFRFNFTFGLHDFTFSNNQEIDERIGEDKTNLYNDSEFYQKKFNAYADIAVLVVDKGYSNAFGIATLPSRPLGSHAIIDLNMLLINPIIFMHELGHCLFAIHNKISNGGNAPEGGCAHGLTFGYRNKPNQTVPDPYRTILAIASLQDLPLIESVAHYSNPNVVFGIEWVNGNFTEVKTGTSNDNNAGIMERYACIANRLDVYDELNPRFLPSVKEVCPGLGTFDLCLEMDQPGQGRPMQPGYYYEWAWNNSTSFPQPNETFKIFSGYEECNTLSISQIQTSQPFHIIVRVCSEHDPDDCINWVSKQITKNSNPNCSDHINYLKSHITDFDADDWSTNESPNADEPTSNFLDFSILSIYNQFGQQISLKNLDITNLSNYSLQHHCLLDCTL